MLSFDKNFTHKTVSKRKCKQYHHTQSAVQLYTNVRFDYENIDITQ